MRTQPSRGSEVNSRTARRPSIASLTSMSASIRFVPASDVDQITRAMRQFDRGQSMNGKFMVSFFVEPTRNHKMSASEIARRHFDAAVTEAEAAGLGHDRYLSSRSRLLVVAAFSFAVGI